MGVLYQSMMTMIYRLTSKSTSHRSGTHVDAHPEVQLLALVEVAQEKGDTWHGATLENAEKGAQATQLLVRGDEGGHHGDETKADDEAGDIKARADFLEEQVRWDLDG